MNYMMAILPKMGGFLLLVLIDYCFTHRYNKRSNALHFRIFYLEVALPRTDDWSDPGKSDHISDNDSIWKNGPITDSYVFCYGSRRNPWKPHLSS